MPAGSLTTHYSARFLAPDLMVRGQVNALSCPVYADGALVEPSAAIVSIFDSSGTAVVDGAAATISGSIASYNYTPSSSVALGTGWRVEWTLTLSGDTHIYRNDAQVVLRALYPVVSDADLFRRVRSLDPSGSAPISSLSDYQDYLDEAWGIITNRLISLGNRPTLITSPSSLREVHLLLTLALIFEDFSTALNESYTLRAEEYRRQYEAAWGQLRFEYDSNEDGRSDGVGKRAAVPSIWLTSRRGR